MSLLIKGRIKIGCGSIEKKGQIRLIKLQILGIMLIMVILKEVFSITQKNQAVFNTVKVQVIHSVIQ